MVRRLFMVGLLAALAAGCGASVDAEGRVLTDRVWFDQQGVAHCPHPDCMPVPKLRPTNEETDRSYVHPFNNVCDARKHPVSWAADDVLCWSCNGAKTCPPCKGSGLIMKKAFASCVAVADGEESTSTTGTGTCVECGGKGTIRYGATVLKPH